MPDPGTLLDVEPILRAARTVAVLGAHTDEGRPAHYVPAWLRAAGARVLPVNPRLVGASIFGEPVRGTLAELREPVDLVLVFRRSEDVPGHLLDLLALDPPPRAVWLQEGIRHAGVAGRLRAEGIAVVQDRCAMVDHQRLRIGRLP